MKIVTSKIKRTINFLGILFLSVLFMNVFVLTSVHADTKLLVKWDDIIGNMEIAGYEDYFQALDSGMRVSNNCPPGVIPPECKAILEGYTITKYADLDSPKLAGFCVNNYRQDEVNIASISVEGKSVRTIWEVKLEGVRISQIASGVDSTDGRLLVAYELIPQRITWIFYHYDSKGNLIETIEKLWIIQE